MLQWKTRGNLVIALQNLEAAKPCKEQTKSLSGKEKWSGKMGRSQCLSQQTRGLGFGTSGVRIVVWPVRTHISVIR